MSDEANIAARLGENIRRYPDKPCTIFARHDQFDLYSFGDLGRDAAAIAARILARPGAIGDTIFIIHENAPQLWAAFWGAVLAGRIPAIMPPPSIKQRNDLYWNAQRAILQRTGPRYLIISDALRGLLAERLPEYAELVLLPGENDAERAQGFEDILNRTSSGPDDVAFLQHSSGTTALKKGVLLTHRVVLNQIDKYAGSLDFGPDDVIASWLPLYHDMGLIACFLMPLVCGATVVTLDPFEWLVRPVHLLRCIEKYRATFCWMPNFAFNHLANSVTPAGIDLSSMRAFINCSEPCKKDVQDRFERHFVEAGLRSPVQVCYAMAENVFAVAQTAVGRRGASLKVTTLGLQDGVVILADEAQQSTEVLSCGIPLANTEVKIVDDARHELGERAIGEIAISSDCLFTGYYRLPERSHAVLTDNWYYTGDIGFIHDQEIYILGRKDDAIIAYGRNFLAHELEAIASEQPGVKPGRVVAFGYDSARTATNEIVILFEPADDGDSEMATTGVRQAVQAQAGIVPRYVISVPRETLLKTTSGKISRELNRDLFIVRQNP